MYMHHTHTKPSITSTIFFYTKNSLAGEVDQWVKVLAVKPEFKLQNPHGRRKNEVLQIVLTHTLTKCNNFLNYTYVKTHFWKHYLNICLS